MSKHMRYRLWRIWQGLCLALWGDPATEADPARQREADEDGFYW